jgi:hypothetical protein
VAFFLKRMISDIDNEKKGKGVKRKKDSIMLERKNSCISQAAHSQVIPKRRPRSKEASIPKALLEKSRFPTRQVSSAQRSTTVTTTDLPSSVVREQKIRQVMRGIKK